MSNFKRVANDSIEGKVLNRKLYLNVVEYFGSLGRGQDIVLFENVRDAATALAQEKQRVQGQLLDVDVRGKVDKTEQGAAAAPPLQLLDTGSTSDDPSCRCLQASSYKCLDRNLRQVQKLPYNNHIVKLSSCSTLSISGKFKCHVQLAAFPNRNKLMLLLMIDDSWLKLRLQVAEANAANWHIQHFDEVATTEDLPAEAAGHTPLAAMLWHAQLAVNE